ncbi:MFS transporter [Actinomadura kijaniata]|uniref:EmrB/QacA subfamily drug resistance transporter n=1 Tax=Actinomadura namibiensis TaxID=182080 RepID=A0A7W3LLP5_ACTNM|nr:DHA2 family efflux MFS transporter permease subunit [Actinomadura namibiensis]MBA8950393.1 EmrB/QacA subfamily drug resistance transporter [Actinomadura namibiensis]
MATAAPPREDAAASPAADPRAMTIALVLVLGAIMTTLDMTIVNVAIHRFTLQFDAPLATVQWVTTGYSLALGAVIPSTAWAVGRFGAKRLYLVAIVLFVAGSVLAGLAWNIQSLIAFRVVQGLGGGMVMPVGMTILIRAAGPDRMGRLMSTLGLAILVGPLAGPVLGGYLVDEVSWRWMFLLNLPLGAVVLLLATRIFPADVPGERRPLDVLGLALLSPGLAAFVYGVTAGGERGDFGSAGVLVPTVAGVVLVAAFVARALTARYPLIDLGLFRNRAFAAATATTTVFVLGYFGTMILGPLYFQVVRGESATVAGALGIPFALASGTAMQVTGRIVDRVGPGRVVPFGVVTAVAGFGLFVFLLSADVPYWALGGAMLLMGAGGGSTIMPAMTAATKQLAPGQAASGSTTVNLVNTTMGAVGTAVISVVLAANLPGGSGALRGAVPADAGALAEAFRGTYVWSLAFVALAIVPALLIPRRR